MSGSLGGWTGLILPWLSLPPSGLDPVQNELERPERLPWNAVTEAHARAPRPQPPYGWKSAPKAPRIGPRVSPTPNTSPVRLQLPMMPSGPSAS